MTCSIISEKMNVVMDSASSQTGNQVSGSALQNPDISRSQLGALLRRRRPEQTSTSRRAFWSSFETFYIPSHANSNK